MDIGPSECEIKDRDTVWDMLFKKYSAVTDHDDIGMSLDELDNYGDEVEEPDDDDFKPIADGLIHNLYPEDDIDAVKQNEIEETPGVDFSKALVLASKPNHDSLYNMLTKVYKPSYILELKTQYDKKAKMLAKMNLQFFTVHNSFENFNEDMVHIPGYSSSSKSYQRATSNTSYHPYIHDPRQDISYFSSPMNRTQSFPSFFMHPDQSMYSFLPPNLAHLVGNSNQSMNIRVREYDLIVNGSTISLPAQFSHHYDPHYHQRMLQHQPQAPSSSNTFKKPLPIAAGMAKQHNGNAKMKKKVIISSSSESDSHSEPLIKKKESKIRKKKEMKRIKKVSTSSESDGEDTLIHKSPVKICKVNLGEPVDLMARKEMAQANCDTSKKATKTNDEKTPKNSTNKKAEKENESSMKDERKIKPGPKFTKCDESKRDKIKEKEGEKVNLASAAADIKENNKKIEEKHRSENSLKSESKSKNKKKYKPGPKFTKDDTNKFHDEKVERALTEIEKKSVQVIQKLVTNLTEKKPVQLPDKNEKAQKSVVAKQNEKPPESQEKFQQKVDVKKAAKEPSRIPIKKEGNKIDPPAKDKQSKSNNSKDFNTNNSSAAITDNIKIPKKEEKKKEDKNMEQSNVSKADKKPNTSAPTGKSKVPVNNQNSCKKLMTRNDVDFSCDSLSSDDEPISVHVYIMKKLEKIKKQQNTTAAQVTVVEATKKINKVNVDDYEDDDEFFKRVFERAKKKQNTTAAQVTVVEATKKINKVNVDDYEDDDEFFKRVFERAKKKQTS